MGVEIERKFLVTGDAWRNAEPVYYCQGYLNRDKHRTVRVRIAGDRGLLTIKGLASGSRRSEYEYSIPIDDAKEMLGLSDGPVVEKYRRVIEHAGLMWEVDEFLGDNEGLVVAEVELESEDQTVDIPDWVGSEVTNDARYFNSNLAAKPYKLWPDRGTW